MYYCPHCSQRLTYSEEESVSYDPREFGGAKYTIHKGYECAECDEFFSPCEVEDHQGDGDDDYSFMKENEL